MAVLVSSHQPNFPLSRFFRFDSNIRKSVEVGFSTNHAEGTSERGLSCYYLEDCSTSTRSEIVAEIIKNWNAGAFVSLNGQFSQLWEIEGKIVGYGSDGEPLLENVKVIGEIK